MCWIRYILILLLTSSWSVVLGQSLQLGGTVSGYNYNPKNGLFDKGGDIALEGYLGNVILTISNKDGVLFSKSTNAKGEFLISLPLGAVYDLSYAKDGYEKSIVRIDLSWAKGLNKDLNFKSLELILNSYTQAKSEKDIAHFGTIYYNSQELKLEFVPSEESGGLLKKKIDYGPAISLIEKSITKNEAYLLKSPKGSVTLSQVDNNLLSQDTVQFKDHDSDYVTFMGESLLERSKSGSYILAKELLNTNNVEDKKGLLVKAKEQLEIDWLSAQTAVDSLYLMEREALILSMESDLKKAEEIIVLKETEIHQKNKILWLLIGLFVLACTGIWVYYRMWKDKKSMNEILVKKDNKILESLNYAQKIQEAVLPTHLEVSQLIPNSFVIYWPKDIVSGDFYWLKEVKGKIIIASVDCTGHGVPGAFMSMIGNTLMNQIIIEEGIISPKDILKRLDEEIKAALKQDDNNPFGNQDGMDMSICVIDHKAMKMTYAGAMNPIYRVSKNRVELLDVSKIGVGGMKFVKIAYEEFTVELTPGESIYMMSDGYMDQFGGEINEKFNLPRFKSLLAKVHDQPMKDQKYTFEKTIKDWQGEHEQTDDILVIGIKVN